MFYHNIQPYIQNIIYVKFQKQFKKSFIITYNFCKILSIFKKIYQ